MTFFRILIIILVVLNILTLMLWYQIDKDFSLHKIINTAKNQINYSAEIYENVRLKIASLIDNYINFINSVNQNSNPSEISNNVQESISKKVNPPNTEKDRLQIIFEELSISEIMQKQLLCISFPSQSFDKTSLSPNSNDFLASLPQKKTKLGRLQILGKSNFDELISPLVQGSFYISTPLPAEMPNYLTNKKPITIFFSNYQEALDLANFFKNNTSELIQNQVVDTIDLLLLPKDNHKLLFYFRQQQQELQKHLPEIWAIKNNCN